MFVYWALTWVSKCERELHKLILELKRKMSFFETRKADKEEFFNQRA